jgi:hypothetical protein
MKSKNKTAHTIKITENKLNRRVKIIVLLKKIKTSKMEVLI